MTDAWTVDTSNRAKYVSDRPVVQDSQYDEHVEIVWPDKHEVTVLHQEVAMAIFTDMMRVVTEIDADTLPNNPDDALDDIEDAW